MRGVFALAIACSMAASVAWAQTAPGDLEAEHRRGQALFREHHDAEAREVFRRLVERTQEPRALARLASTEVALGEWVAAEAHLRAALASRNDPWIVANRAGADGGLEGDLRRYQSHVGRLEVLSVTPGAELWMGGARVATLPMRAPIVVLAGDVGFELRALGYVTEQRHEHVDGGPDALTRATLTLQPQAAVESPAVTSAVTSTVVAPARVVDAPPEPTRSPLRAVGIAAMGVGVVGLAAGVVGIALRNAHASSFNDIARCGRTNDVVVGGASCQSESDTGRDFETMATVGFVTGGVFAVAGVVLFVVSPPSQRARARPVTLGGGPGDLGVALTGSF